MRDVIVRFPDEIAIHDTNENIVRAYCRYVEKQERRKRRERNRILRNLSDAGRNRVLGV